MLHPVGAPWQCVLCGDKAEIRCSVCKTLYCSPACRDDHWIVHQASCLPPPPFELLKQRVKNSPKNSSTDTNGDVSGDPDPSAATPDKSTKSVVAQPRLRQPMGSVDSSVDGVRNVSASLSALSLAKSSQPVEKEPVVNEEGDKQIMANHFRLPLRPAGSPMVMVKSEPPGPDNRLDAQKVSSPAAAATALRDQPGTGLPGGSSGSRLPPCSPARTQESGRSFAGIGSATTSSGGSTPSSPAASSWEANDAVGSLKVGDRCFLMGLGDKMNRVLVQADHPDTEKSLSMITSTLVDCAKTPMRYEPKAGMLVACKWSDCPDGLYYRALIKAKIDESGDRFFVRFVDYGNESFESSKDFVNVPDCLSKMSVPFCAKELALADVRDAHWVLSHKNRVMPELIRYQEMPLKVTMVDERKGTVSLELADSRLSFNNIFSSMID